MTARELLYQRKRWYTRASLLGWLMGAAGMLAGVLVGQPPVLWLMLPGMVLFLLAAVVGMFFIFWCPACKANLSKLFMNHLDDRIRFCPYCSQSLDVEVEQQVQIAKKPQ